MSTSEDRIFNELSNIHARVTQLCVESAEFRASCKACKARVDGIEHDINGNGSAGLKRDVHGLKAEVAKLHTHEHHENGTVDDGRQWSALGRRMVSEVVRAAVTVVAAVAAAIGATR
jgi:hypothetical protein